MVTAVTLIMWVFLTDGSSTRTTEEAQSLMQCWIGANKYMLNQHEEHETDPSSTYAAGCIVHQQRVS